jgi:tetratricopeptide (TPR) repeat protein
MSYDLIFWRGPAGEEPSATYLRLVRGDWVAGIQELSVEEVRAAFREEFPDLKERGPEHLGFLGPLFDVLLLAPPIRAVFVCCAWGVLKRPEILEKIERAGYTRLRCHLYNPQVNEFRENAADRQHNITKAQARIGDVLLAQGNLPAALDAYQACLAIAERHARASPGDGECQYYITVAQAKIGEVLLAQGNLTAALDAFQASLAIRERFAKAYPENAELQCDMARSLLLTGYAAEKQGCRDKAMADYRRGLEIMRRLTALAPDHAAFKRHLARFEKRIAQL